MGPSGPVRNKIREKRRQNGKPHGRTELEKIVHYGERTVFLAPYYIRRALFQGGPDHEEGHIPPPAVTAALFFSRIRGAARRASSSAPFPTGAGS